MKIIEPHLDYNPSQVKYELNPTQKLILKNRTPGLYWSRYGIYLRSFFLCHWNSLFKVFLGLDIKNESIHHKFALTQSLRIHNQKIFFEFTKWNVSTAICILYVLSELRTASTLLSWLGKNLFFQNKVD